jgi:uncharacterized protein YeaC (DUF1315 family)
MAQLSPETIKRIQTILSDTIRSKYPQPDLSDEQKQFILSNVMTYSQNHNNHNHKLAMRVCTYFDVEEEFRQHLFLQPSCTFLELPLGYTSAMVDRRAFWVVLDKIIYQIQTNIAVDRCVMICPV